MALQDDLESVIDEIMPSKTANDTPLFIAGLAVGALAGAAAVLLYAPRSGEHTRKDVVNQGVELRTRAGDAQVIFRDRGMNMLDGQKSRWELAKQAAKEAAEEKRAELLAKFDEARKEGEI